MPPRRRSRDERSAVPRTTHFPADRPQVVAHRGSSAAKAEHTLGAYLAALDEGAEALECDIRLTADGQVRTCLFSRTESDLRGPMRLGATDAELADRWIVAAGGKQAGHGIDDPSFLQPDRPMSAIGG